MMQAIVWSASQVTNHISTLQAPYANLSRASSALASPAWSAGVGPYENEPAITESYFLEEKTFHVDTPPQVLRAPSPPFPCSHSL